MVYTRKRGRVYSAQYEGWYFASAVIISLVVTSDCLRKSFLSFANFSNVYCVCFTTHCLKRSCFFLTYLVFLSQMMQISGSIEEPADEHVEIDELLCNMTVSVRYDDLSTIWVLPDYSSCQLSGPRISFWYVLVSSSL